MRHQRACYQNRRTWTNCCHQLSVIQYVGLCVFSLPISFVMIERIHILCLIIIIKSEVWTITNCLGLDSWSNGMRCMYFYILMGAVNASWNKVELWHLWSWRYEHQNMLIRHNMHLIWSLHTTGKFAISTKIKVITRPGNITNFANSASNSMTMKVDISHIPYHPRTCHVTGFVPSSIMNMSVNMVVCNTLWDNAMLRLRCNFPWSIYWIISLVLINIMVHGWYSLTKTILSIRRGHN